MTRPGNSRRRGPVTVVKWYGYGMVLGGLMIAAVVWVNDRGEAFVPFVVIPALAGVVLGLVLLVRNPDAPWY